MSSPSSFYSCNIYSSSCAYGFAFDYGLYGDLINFEGGSLAIDLSTSARLQTSTYETSIEKFHVFEKTNKLSFTECFANCREVALALNSIFYKISKESKANSTSPLQIQITGTIQGDSESIVAAVKVWLEKNKENLSVMSNAFRSNE